MDMNKRMWNRHKKALLDGVRNATDSDMQARFTEQIGRASCRERVYWLV